MLHYVENRMYGVGYSKERVCVLLILVVGMYKSSTDITSETYGEMYYKNATFTPTLIFDCGVGYQLAHLHVLAGVELFDSHCKEIVYGQSVDLISALNDCHWKQSCTVGFPQHKMVKCFENETTNSKPKFSTLSYPGPCSCLLKDAEFLLPIEAVCVQRKAVFHISARRRYRRLAVRKQSEGIILSHDIIPWFYEEGDRRHKKSKTFNMRLNKNNVVVVIGFQFVDLCEYDSLTLKTNTLVYKVNNSLHSYVLPHAFKREDKYVKIRFKMEDATNGCGGWVLCFRAVKQRNTETIRKYLQNEIQVCDDVYKKDANLTVISLPER